MNTPSYRTLWLVWAWLTCLTLLAAWLMDAGMGQQISHRWLALSGLGFAWLKGIALIEHYMGLRHAPGWLRWGMHSWLGGITVLLVVFL